jgi:hypothetical protein
MLRNFVFMAALAATKFVAPIEAAAAPPSQKYDYVVVGSGAGGGSLAYEFHIDFN